MLANQSTAINLLIVVCSASQFNSFNQVFSRRISRGTKSSPTGTDFHVKFSPNLTADLVHVAIARVTSYSIHQYENVFPFVEVPSYGPRYIPLSFCLWLAWSVTDVVHVSMKRTCDKKSNHAEVMVKESQKSISSSHRKFERCTAAFCNSSIFLN